MTIVNCPTVLIVDDDEGVALLEKIRLEEAGYDTVVASTADEALNAIRLGGIDLVLLDFRLPDDTDGLEFYARVKAEGLDPPVILVTGFGNEATVIRALRGSPRLRHQVGGIPGLPTRGSWPRPPASPDGESTDRIGDSPGERHCLGEGRDHYRRSRPADLAIQSGRRAHVSL